MTSVDR